MLSRVFRGVALLGLLGSSVSVLAQQEPLLYVSFHGGKTGLNNINSYYLNGTLAVDGVLQGDDNASEMRSGLMMPDGTLLMANAYKKDSRITQYSACSASGQRQYVGDWATDGLSHPYGLAMGLDAASAANAVWVTNQDTFDLVQFSTSGVFQQQIKQFGSDELRAVAYDTNTDVLYLADEDANAVLAYDTRSNSWNSSLNFNVPVPIGLLVDEAARVLYVGSHGNTSSTVQAFSLDTRQLLQTYSDSNLSHPAGMVKFDQTLYVLSQDNTALLAFNTQTASLSSVLIPQFPDTPEQIFFSPC